MINQLARYLPVLGTLARAEGPVLELGCGAAGVGRWARRAFVGCDRSFTDYNTATVEEGSPMQPVAADAIYLPFRRMKDPIGIGAGAFGVFTSGGLIADASAR